ncbi:MAG: alpha,alpha-trehalose-phosphate synthase (UDP-forming) [Actinomycetes bacterium]
MPNADHTLADLLVASNRGPLSFTEADDGTLEASRGGGGLVSGLSSLGAGAHETVWVCAALTDGDRAATRGAEGGRLDRAGHDTGGAAVRMLDIDPATFHRAYNAIANSTLWFIHHLLYAIPTAPAFDAVFRREWASYEAYNRAFAAALAEDAAPDAKVLVQDYHLTLAPRYLRELRPDVRIAHFSHTPWAPPDYFRLLPDDVARATLLGVLGADHAGFHSSRWARAFADCCAQVLGAECAADGTSVTYEGRTTNLGQHPLGVDVDSLRQRAGEDDVENRRNGMLDAIGDRRAIVRVDRTELSKNIGRGLLAYRELLRRYPQWHGRVVHIASAYPSRHDLPEYREYTATVQRMAAEIEDEFGTPDWRPIILHVTDDYARALALYRIGDVLLVNPVRDGMNLVAKEVPVLSERGCVLVLSTEAGAADELGEHTLLVNPFDVSGTADALHAALSMPEAERRERTDRLAQIAGRLPPARWLADQVAALD